MRRQVWPLGCSCRATRGLGGLPGSRPAAPAAGRQLSSQVSSGSRLVDRAGARSGSGPDLVARRWARGSRSPRPPHGPPVAQARPPPSRGRAPLLATQGLGWVRTESLTWTAVPPAPPSLAARPAPNPAGPRPTDTEAEVRPAAPPSDSPRQPLAAPGAVASTAACPISVQPERRARRRDYTNTAGAASLPSRSVVPPTRRSDGADSQSYH